MTDTTTTHADDGTVAPVGPEMKERLRIASARVAEHQRHVVAAKHEMQQVMVDASEVGWSLRRIGAAAGMSAEMVRRHISDAATRRG